MTYPYQYSGYQYPQYDDGGMSGYTAVGLAAYNYTATTGYDDTGAYRTPAAPPRSFPAPGSRQAGEPMRYPRTPEDRILERGRDPDPGFWQGPTGEFTWNYIDEVESTGPGDRELDRERRHNIRLEERRERSRDRHGKGRGRHKSGDKHHYSTSDRHYKEERHHHKHEKHEKDKHNKDHKHDKRDKHDRYDRNDREDKHDKHDRRHKHHRRDSEGGHHRKSR